MTKIRVTGPLVVAIAAAMSLAACGSGGTTAGGSPKSSGGASAQNGSGSGHKTICWANPQAKQPVFQTFTAALNAAAKRQNTKVITLDGQANPATQVSDIQTCITDHADAIVIYTLQEEAEVTALNEAHAAGIKIVGVNAIMGSYGKTPTVSAPYDANLDLGFVTGAHDAGKWVAQQLGGKGNVVGIKIPVPVPSLVAMLTAYKTYVTQGNSVKWLAELPDATDDLAGARSSVADAATRYHGQINGVLSYTDIGAVGAAQALTSAGVKGAVIVGLQGNQSGIDALKAGTIQGDVDTEPYKAAVYALALTNAVLDGKPHAKFISSPVKFLTKDNVNSYVKWSQGVADIASGKTSLTVDVTK